jgi:hypothetical protein
MDTTHFAPFITHDAAPPKAFCAPDPVGFYDSYCNSLGMVTCEKCKERYNEMRERSAKQKASVESKLEGLLSSYRCGFITLEEYVRSVNEVALLCFAEFGSNEEEFANF